MGVSICHCLLITLFHLNMCCKILTHIVPLWFIYCEFGSTCTDISSLTHRNKYIKNYLYGVYSTPNILECATLCQSHQACKSFGFNQKSHDCHLHVKTSSMVPGDFQPMEEWIHGDLSSLPGVRILYFDINYKPLRLYLYARRGRSCGQYVW